MTGIAGCCARAASGHAAAAPPMSVMNSRRLISSYRLRPSYSMSNAGAQGAGVGEIIAARFPVMTACSSGVLVTM